MIIGERLKGFLKYRNITAKEFAEVIGVTEGMVYKYYKMDSVDSSIIEKWAETLYVPIMMFLDQNIYDSIVQEASLPKPTNPEGYIASSKKIISDLNRQPILDIRVSAGHGIGLEGNENEVVEWVNIPKFDGCYGIMVYGDSMYDRFKSGDVVFVRPIKGRNDFDFGQCYVVITNEDRYIKNIYESSKGNQYVTMTSYNTEINPDGRRKYPDKDIYIDDIKHLYKVAGKLRRDQL